MTSLFVPTLALDLGLLDRLAASIDCHIQHKVIINNGKYGALDGWLTAHPDWVVLNQGRNLGVAASWNLVAQICPGERYWFICNDDVEFFPGRLETIYRSAEREADNYPILFLTTTHPFWAFVWTRRGINDYGTFDENFWPAYYEDYEMRLRYNMAGQKHFYIFGDESPANHGKPTTGGQNYVAMINAFGLFTRPYFKRKWNILDDHDSSEAFKTPYNIPHAPLTHWEFDPLMRRKMEPIWHAFWSQPHPSIYK